MKISHSAIDDVSMMFKLKNDHYSLRTATIDGVFGFIEQKFVNLSLAFARRLFFLAILPSIVDISFNPFKPMIPLFDCTLFDEKEIRFVWYTDGAFRISSHLNFPSIPRRGFDSNVKFLPLRADAIIYFAKYVSDMIDHGMAFDGFRNAKATRSTRLEIDP